MARYEYRIRSLETDIHDNVKPKTMLRIAIDGVSRQSDHEGASFERMEKEIGAVWMLARLKYEQFLPVRGGETLFADVSGRTLERGTYIRTIEFRNSSETLAGKTTMVSMAVEKKTRHILRANAVERLFSHAPLPEGAPPLKRVRLRDELPQIGEITVRYGDCDVNGHLSGPAYADVVCEALGYWSGQPVLCRELQIDYSAECPPGSVVALQGKKDGEAFELRGIRQDGIISFTAVGRFMTIDC